MGMGTKGRRASRRAGGASRKTQRGRKPLDEFRAAASSRSLNYTCFNFPPVPLGLCPSPLPLPRACHLYIRIPPTPIFDSLCAIISIPDLSPFGAPVLFVVSPVHRQPSPDIIRADAPPASASNNGCATPAVPPTFPFQPPRRRCHCQHRGCRSGSPSPGSLPLARL